MPRKPRVEFSGAFYHVIVRGNHGQAIFSDDRDRRKYLSILLDYRQKYNFSLYAFVLMSNHVHLLIEVRDVYLSKIMQGLNQRYTQYYNLRYKQHGHLMQGRYKAILCQRDSYLLDLVAYVHINPVRAGMVLNPADYHWSSHRYYLSNAYRNSGLIEVDKMFRFFSETPSVAKKKYLEFLHTRINQGHQKRFYPQQDVRILGDNNFLEGLGLTVTGETVVGKASFSSNEINKHKRKYALRDIIKAVEDITGINREAVKKRGRGKDITKARTLLIAAARNNAACSSREIAEYLQRDPALITRAASNFQDFNLLSRVENWLNEKCC